MSLSFTILLLLTCPSLKTNRLKPITSANDHKFKINGVRMNDACLPTPSLQIMSSTFPPPLLLLGKHLFSEASMRHLPLHTLRHILHMLQEARAKLHW